MPRQISLPTLAVAAQRCRGCQLYCNATQAVFGEGPRHATLVLVGEQPGEQEDRAGRPFVGTAGRVMDEALAAAGIDRAAVYVTNAVKHFKWEQRGKRRVHSKPSWREVVACRPWLIEELNLIQPRITVAMGATAAQSLLGNGFRLTQHRQELLVSEFAPTVVATIHPSSILRMPDAAARDAARRQLAEDFAFVTRHLKKTPAR